MSSELATIDPNSKEMLQLMKDTICKGSSDDEFKLFAYTCKRLGLDPFSRQIFPVKRWDSGLGKEVMSIQTGIDGYRLIADRTGRYAPGKDPEFTYDSKGKLISARAFVMKQTPDSTWHEVSASAHYSEYAALKKDGKPNHMWATKPHIMLAKCAEALALRKAFPAELSGVYTKEEMEQADNPVVVTTIPKHIPACTQDEYDAFIDAWGQTYDPALIKEYIKAKSYYENTNELQAAHSLMQDQTIFEKKFNTWCDMNKEAKSKAS